MAKYSITYRGDRKLKKVLLPIVAVVLAVGLALPAVAQVEPLTVEEEVAPGCSMTVEKTITVVNELTADADVWWKVTFVDLDLTVELTPAVHYDVSGGSTVSFEETIAVSPNESQCTILEATVTFYANEYPEDGEVIGTQKISITVKDVQAPMVWYEETVNPHGKNIPDKKEADNAKGNGKNPDGFYKLYATDNCDPEPQIWVGTADNPKLFGSYVSGTVVKFTEAPGAAPSEKKMGSTKGQAGAVSYHITLPSNPVILTTVDSSGNTATSTCLMPPASK